MATEVKMPILAASIADKPFTSGSTLMKDYLEGLPARSHTSTIAENVTRDKGDNDSTREISTQSDEEQEYIEAQEGEEIRDDLITWEELASHSHVVGTPASTSAECLEEYAEELVVEERDAKLKGFKQKLKGFKQKVKDERLD